MNGDNAMLEAFAADGIAKQKLHVMLVVDTSRSMQGERISQVNAAISDIHNYLVGLQYENTNVDFYMSIMTFANRAEFVPGYKGVKVDEMKPLQLKAIGYSNLHCAYEELSTVLHKESKGGMMPEFGGIAPVILLLTDGHPTKDTSAQLEELRKLAWFRAALRYGIAIELNDERTMKVLTDFTDDKDCVIECFNAGMLAKIIQIIVMTASKVKSQSSAVRGNNAVKVKDKAPVSTNAHEAVKQEVKDTLEEIDDWEW